MATIPQGEKRQREEEEGKEEGERATKRVRSDSPPPVPAPALKPSVKRFEPLARGPWRLIVVEVGEEVDATNVHVIEGNGGGLDDFKELLVECSRRDNEVTWPLTASALSTMEEEKFESQIGCLPYKAYRKYWRLFRALYVKHDLTYYCVPHYVPELERVIETSGFFIIKGVF